MSTLHIVPRHDVIVHDNSTDLRSPVAMIRTMVHKWAINYWI